MILTEDIYNYILCVVRIFMNQTLKCPKMPIAQMPIAPILNTPLYTHIIKIYGEYLQM